MNILFISGSPRKSGNVSKIIDNISKHLNENYDVEKIYITDYQINGCLGCNHCQGIISEPGCVQQDDAKDLLEKIIKADIIFYGTPLYGHSYSGQLKLFLDRHVSLFKFIEGSEKAVEEMTIFSFIKDKPVGLIVSCQGPNENNTELVQMQFDKFCESSLTKCIGKYVFPWCTPNADESTYDEKQILEIIKTIDNYL